MKRKVIAITDGDMLARKALDRITALVGGSFISRSAGNPTPLTGPELVEQIGRASADPVFVLLDDRGQHGVGKGEEALAYLARDPSVDLLGVVAVASDIDGEKGVAVDYSITNEGNVHQGPVDKAGNPTNGSYLIGDTVSILSEIDIPLIIGTGDTGKMTGKDRHQIGSPITLKAVEAILADSQGNQPN